MRRYKSRQKYKDAEACMRGKETKVNYGSKETV